MRAILVLILAALAYLFGAVSGYWSQEPQYPTFYQAMGWVGALCVLACVFASEFVNREV